MNINNELSDPINEGLIDISNADIQSVVRFLNIIPEINSIKNITVNLQICLVIDCKINQISFVPLATNWFSAPGEGGDYQNIATSILRLLTKLGYGEAAEIYGSWLDDHWSS